MLPPRGEKLWVQLDDQGTETSLAESKACFNRLIVNSSHTDYATLKSSLEMLPPRGEKLWVQLDDQGTETSLAESKACFNRLIVNSSHTDYATLKSSLSKALKYGSRGYYSI